MKKPVSTAPTELPPADNGMRQVALSPEDKRKWEDTMSMMMWSAPGFQHLFYKLLNAQGNTPSDYAAVMSPDAGIACTDGRNIAVNPERFFKEFSLSERVFITGHEIVHNVFDDVNLLHRCHSIGKVPMMDGSFKKFDEATMQKAMDARINALLMESQIGKAPKIGHFDKTVKGSDSVLDVYKKYYEEQEDEDGNIPGGKGGNPGGFDVLKKPGHIGGKPGPGQPQPQPATREQWSVEIAAAETIEQARSQGKMAAALKRMFKELLEPEVPWTEYIETLINRVVGDGGIDWTQPNPWFGAFDFFVPAETGKGAGWIVIWGDTSGSRGDDELASNIAELRGIMESVNPARLTLIWCDADIEDGSVIELTDPADLHDLKPVGGGGTSYQPVIDWIRENSHGGSPDLFIGFTDGYVSHPDHELPFPVIWASSTDHAYPFGQVVKVNRVVRA